MEEDFLLPLETSKDDLEERVTSGRYPPCILYRILYTGPEERRVSSALVTVQVHGADVPLTFTCSIKQEKCECVHVRMCTMLLQGYNCMSLLHVCFCTILCSLTCITLHSLLWISCPTVVSW